MKSQILKALAKVPTAIKTTAKSEIKQQMGLIPLKAQIHLENKLQHSLEASINEYRDIPQQIQSEFKRISTHQSRQPFSSSSNQYFNGYYQSQQQRATATPQPNLAELLYIREQSTKKY